MTKHFIILLSIFFIGCGPSLVSTGAKTVIKENEDEKTFSESWDDATIKLGIKGELVLAVNIEKETDKIEDFNFKEIKEIINEVGVKKAYQQLKSKYKISRNEFYKLSIDLK